LIPGRGKKPWSMPGWIRPPEGVGEKRSPARKVGPTRRHGSTSTKGGVREAQPPRVRPGSQLRKRSYDEAAHQIVSLATCAVFPKAGGGKKGEDTPCPKEHSGAPAGCCADKSGIKLRKMSLKAAKKER